MLGKCPIFKREYLDFVSIPCKVSGEILEGKVLNIFGKLDCDISPDRIEACHRVGRANDTVITKFSGQKES